MEQILITGANRGLGLGLAQQYLSQGNFVLAACRKPSETLLDLAQAHPDLLKIATLDVASEESVEELRREIAKQGFRFTIVLNNAGICPEEAFGSWTASTFSDAFRVNVIGPALLSQALRPFLQSGAKLIQISSGRGSLSENQSPEDALDAYGISKAALNLLTRRMAAKFTEQGVMVVALNPGWMRTDMGGAAAPMSVEAAATKICETIQNLSAEDHGCFLDYAGQHVDW